MKKLLLIFLLTLSLTLSLASCNDECTEHRDVNGNGVCDECGRECAKTAHKLIYSISERSLVRNSSFNSFRNKLLIVLLEISVL